MTTEPMAPRGYVNIGGYYHRIDAITTISDVNGDGRVTLNVGGLVWRAHGMTLAQVLEAIEMAQ